MSCASQDKFILDATAGFRMMWENKQHPNCLYIDLRSEVKPDEVQDFRKLPYPNETFKLIIFDPPHKWLKEYNKNMNFLHLFGGLTPETWQSDLKRGFAELWRVLKLDGILLFKWNDDRISVKRLLPLFPVKHLISQTVSGGKYSNSYWFAFMKIPVKEGV